MNSRNKPTSTEVWNRFLQTPVFPHTPLLIRSLVAQLRGNSSPSSPTEAMPDLAGLGIEEAAPPPPPRPSATSKPVAPVPTAQRPRYTTDDESEDEDDDNPFADSQAVATPVLEQGEFRV